MAELTDQTRHRKGVGLVPKASPWDAGFVVCSQGFRVDDVDAPGTQRHAHKQNPKLQKRIVTGTQAVLLVDG